MEIRIGVVDSPKEISLEIDEAVEDVAKRVDATLEAAAGVFWLTDSRGKRVGVPAARIAYVEMDPESGPRSVGFKP